MKTYTVNILIIIAFTTAGCGQIITLPVFAASENQTIQTAKNDTPKPETAKTIQIPQDSPIRERLIIDTPHIEDITTKFSAPATVEADPARFARICPPLAGRLLKLNARLGDDIKEGQELARMDSPDFAEAQGDYAAAQNALDLAQKSLKRVKTLYEHGVAAQKELEQTQSEYNTAQNDLERAQNRLAQYTSEPNHKQAGPIIIKSPITGRVIELTAAKGEYLNDPSAPLMTIADLSTVWLTADVQEKDARFVRKGGKVTATLDAYPEETFQGEILFVGDMLSIETRSLKVHIAFPNPDGRIKLGMFANASFIGDNAQTTTIPSTAVFQIDGVSKVYVETAPWTFETREIKTGRQDGEKTTVLAGLSPSERIIIREGSLLQ